MDSDVLKGKWNQITGEVKSRWGKLTDDDLLEAEGDREKLAGKITASSIAPTIEMRSGASSGKLGRSPRSGRCAGDGRRPGDDSRR